MSRRLLLHLIFVLALLLSILAGVTVAQPEPPAEEPGSMPGAATAFAPGEEVVGLATAAFSGGADYDSGWVSLEQGEAKTLTHSLGGNTDDYVVDMQYKYGSSINQRYYGGADFGATAFSGTREDDRVGAYWRSLTISTITVYRRPEDTHAEQVRIRIWVDSSPDYDSGWTSLTPGAASTTLTHSLGGDADDYVVDMQYRSTGDGVNQRYYGGADFGATALSGSREDDRVGLYWRSLNNSTINLFRRAEDNYADDVRVRIWVRPTPTYDSGWVSVSQDAANTLTHNIGGNAEDYWVDMQYRSAGSGVNQRYYGGADFGASPPSGMGENDRVGAYWRSLTDSSITVYRRPEDIYASEVRIRIWSFWKPSVPDYDSGWAALGAGASSTALTHNLGGNTDDYLVDMQYKSSGGSVNRRYYGGTDFGATAFDGSREDDRVGAYWRSLSTTSITVYRRPEDDYAAQVRIRIWRAPTPDYDSGWISLTAGAAATTLSHNVGDSILDYLVDMQYRSGGSGVNQRYYGGADFGASPPGGTNENDRVGAYWRNLYPSSITVYRRPEDIYAPEVRVRIWRMAQPDYDSGWQAVGQDAAQTLTHNLGGSADNYLVTMIYYDDSSANYTNQRHLGGADFGASPPSGYNTDDRVGAYWRSLTSSGITVYRRPEDGFADWLRIRIWVTHYEVFLPLVLRNH